MFSRFTNLFITRMALVFITCACGWPPLTTAVDVAGGAHEGASRFDAPFPAMTKGW